MILTNCTDTRRGISLKQGIRYLEAREMWSVPLELQDEIRGLFRCRTFQRFVDNGVFRLSPLEDGEESTVVKTPAPPADLAPESAVSGLENPAGTATGHLARAPEVVGHQTGGPVPETDTPPVTAVKTAGAGKTTKTRKSAKAKTGAE